MVFSKQIPTQALFPYMIKAPWSIRKKRKKQTSKLNACKSKLFYTPIKPFIGLSFMKQLTQPEKKGLFSRQKNNFLLLKAPTSSWSQKNWTKKKIKTDALNQAIYSPVNQFKIPNFLNIQRCSFQEFLKKGLIQEFENYNCITNSDKTIEIFFYSDYYKLKRSKWTPKQAILKRKSYTCQFYLPVQITNRQTEKVQLQWVLLANLPLMTKYGHFILNGCPRVLMNQIVRSPGIYFRRTLNKNKKTIYSADFIAQRGSWLRLEVDTKKGNIWAKLKKTPKIPVFVLLRALGLNLPSFHTELDYTKLRYLLDLKEQVKSSKKASKFLEPAWILKPGLNNSVESHTLSIVLKKLKKHMKKKVVFSDFERKKRKKKLSLAEKNFKKPREKTPKVQQKFQEKLQKKLGKWLQGKPKNTWLPTYVCESPYTSLFSLCKHLYPFKNNLELDLETAQRFLFRKFLNPRRYNLSRLGRLRINKKLGVSIPLDHTVLTSQDVLVACVFLMDLVEGSLLSDDIDDLKNRKIKPSGELVQDQLAIGLMNLENSIRKKISQPECALTFLTLFNVKPLNQSFREFFGSSPLSQLMDQTNPLSELTHKRRLSSLGPGGIDRETAGMAIRGIHPTHYGRICPIETPEGQNAGLVNSFTIYSNLNKNGLIETPFYKTYQGFLLKNTDALMFSSDQEKNWVLAPGDIQTSKYHFLPATTAIPARQLKEFKRVSRKAVNFIALAPTQMISVATSLIPFLEHNDGNRALMGSNMQRQAVATLRPEKPIVGTGLESRVVSDIGHSLQVKKSGFVSYVDGKKIIVYSQKETCEKSSLNHVLPCFFNKRLKKNPSQTTLLSYKKSTNRLPFKKSLVKMSTQSKWLSCSLLQTKNVLVPKKQEKMLIKKTKQTATFLPEKTKYPFVDYYEKAREKNVFSTTTSSTTLFFSGAKKQSESLFLKNNSQITEQTPFHNTEKSLSSKIGFVLPFQKSQKTNYLNSQQLFFISNGFFKKDFLGQLELTPFFKLNKLVDSKKRPLDPLQLSFSKTGDKKSFFLSLFLKNEKLLFFYCQMVLIDFYKLSTFFQNIDDKKVAQKVKETKTLAKKLSTQLLFSECLSSATKVVAEVVADSGGPFYAKDFFAIEKSLSQRKNTVFFAPNTFFERRRRTLCFSWGKQTFVGDQQSRFFHLAKNFGAFSGGNKRVPTSYLNFIEPNVFFKQNQGHFSKLVEKYTKPNSQKGGFKTVTGQQSKLLLSQSELESRKKELRFLFLTFFSEKKVRLKQKANKSFFLMLKPFLNGFAKNKSKQRANSIKPFFVESYKKTNQKRCLLTSDLKSLFQSLYKINKQNYLPNLCRQNSFFHNAFSRQNDLGVEQSVWRFVANKTSFLTQQKKSASKKVFHEKSFAQAASAGPAKTFFAIEKSLSKSSATNKDDKSFLINSKSQSANKSFMNPLIAKEYPLNGYYRSNQKTYMVHRPIVQEGQWVEKGDILADSSASTQGELAIGQNLLVGYTPWQGYNFEDAVCATRF
uniref:RNA polymerase beta subunit n=1 Tax=Gayralia brasiliensis TaxID=1286870 RepID=UPI002410B6E7|nr:RNA polymerase beta subunit [Gayralia brasiliensis]YP_010733766.1 RNA polymerase beta subunit [Monostroma nitidum]WEG92963.1 RNA polymerase beta subunit [Gayralia brasiliensis]WEG93037.1 RNA polymerase beta subunit [Monostroma nitidum]